jgi:hypothetical protein
LTIKPLPPRARQGDHEVRSADKVADEDREARGIDCNADDFLCVHAPMMPSADGFRVHEF